MAWPNQDVTDSSLASTLLLSNALANSITHAGSLSQMALLQETVSNLLVEPPPAWTLTALTANIATTGSIKSSGTLGIGYATGAGGSVTQASNKTTSVVLSKICGTIVTHNAEMVGGAEAKFTVTNTLVAATDVVNLAIASGGTSGDYGIFPTAVSAGAFDITLTNLSAVSLTEALTINFAILKGVAA